jgi:hypothetical protein
LVPSIQHHQPILQCRSIRSALSIRAHQHHRPIRQHLSIQSGPCFPARQDFRPHQPIQQRPSIRSDP